MGYPSFKNILLILLAAVFVGGAFLLAEYRNKSVEKISYEAPLISTTTASLSPELQNIDSDGDGLKDWEEILLGTNPRNSDSDGDGTSDGKESELGRNPLVKGPNDKASPAGSRLSKTEDLSPIDMAARDFFARYMELRQAGLSQDKQSQEEVIGQVLENSIVLSKPKTYELSSIKTRDDSSKDSIKRYGNEVGSIFLSYSIQSRNEAIIAREFVETENPNVLKEIDPIISSYRNILDALLKLEVPKSLAGIHLGFINGMSYSLFTAESFRKASADPLMGIQGTAGYLESAQRLFDTVRALKAIFNKEEIEYSQGEGGSFFSIQQN